MEKCLTIECGLRSKLLCFVKLCFKLFFCIDKLKQMLSNILHFHSTFALLSEISGNDKAPLELDLSNTTFDWTIWWFWAALVTSINRIVSQGNNTLEIIRNKYRII